MNYHLRDAPVDEEHDMIVNKEAMLRWIPTYMRSPLAFFDVFLRGQGEPSSIPRVRWFLGHEDWHVATEWPPSEAHEQYLFLSMPDRAALGVEGGSLTEKPDSQAGQAFWTHNPHDLVPSTWNVIWSFLLDYPDEAEVEGRDDVLTFTGEPLFGTARPSRSRFRPVVTVASSGPSMHLFVKLCDVGPDGGAHMVLRGQRLIQRDEFGIPIEISLGHTGYRVQAGHRLRLHISSSDFPHYLWHPGTDENPWFASDGVANEQSLATGGPNPSCLRITALGRCEVEPDQVE